MAKGNLRKSRSRKEEKKEFEEEVLQIARVTRVVKGGRRLRFRATVAIGDGKGRVGVGVGKAAEVVNAIKKAVASAKTALIEVPITKGDSIPHPVKVKHKAARMMIMPAVSGTGVIAGGSLRKILNLAGLKNVLGKNLGSRNTLVTAQASIKALQALSPLKPHLMKNNKSQAAPEKASAQPSDEKEAKPAKNAKKTKSSKADK